MAKLRTQKRGKLESLNEQEVDLCIRVYNYTAENGLENLKSEEWTLNNGSKAIVTYYPISIVYRILPWNYPSNQVMRYAIVNLIARNRVLLKHASNLTGTGQLLEKIFVTAGLLKRFI